MGLNLAHSNRGGGALKDEIPSLNLSHLHVSYAVDRPVEHDDPSLELFHWLAELTVPEWHFERTSKLSDLNEELLRSSALRITGTGYVLADAELYRYNSSPDSSAVEALESTSADLEKFICLLGDDDLPAEALNLDVVDIDLLFLDRLRVAPAWRGQLLGPLLASIALSDLGRGCALVGAYPAPFELDPSDQGYEVEQQRLERLWGTFGFKPWQNGVWYLSLATRDLERTSSWLRDHAGARP